uniref:Transporter n=1 Tax=Prevotella sp. GTC17259 TaxID=3236795 RepID=A0AB33JBP8_9BACT
MEILEHLFQGMPGLWGGGVAHSVLILSLVIAMGLSLGKIKIGNVSLGLMWILFFGILFGQLNLNLDEHLLHFMKEFGLILFVYSIGMQVGPSFFSSFRKGGQTLTMLAIITIFLSVVITIILHFTTQTPITTLAGILSGAVTNTPGLGAAQQANSDLNGIDAPEIALGYTVTYPLGIFGVILAFVLLKYILRINKEVEDANAKTGLGHLEELSVRTFTVEVTNEMINGMSIKHIRPMVKRQFVISRIIHAANQAHNALVTGQTTIQLGDKLLIIANPKDIEPIIALMGKSIEMDWTPYEKELISRRILITKPELNGKSLAQLRIRSNFNANITRVNRSGVDLVATPQLQLQMGDRVTVVGTELAIGHTEKILGNSMRRLNTPNIISIFWGIALGCILANIPFVIPGIPAPLKLGLTGGPLVVAILMGCFGPKYRIVTYNTISANLMIREIGICIFLACVGLGAGNSFFDTVISRQGATWVAFGFIITLLPILIGGLIGRYVYHLNYFTMLGVLSGANTNPAALAYSNDLTSTDSAAIAYATVYPFSMFLRIVTVQIMIFAMG